MNIRSLQRHLRSSPRGFSLLELVIAVAIVALLAAIAYPSYLGSVRKGRRSEAVSALTALQQAQERWRANSQSYASTLTSLNSAMPATAATTTPGGYYSLSIDASTQTDYILTAQARSGTPQAADLPCSTLRLQLFNGAIYYGGCNGCSAPSPGGRVSDPNNCWAK
jgi:type IV pilus assembly protein PilE